MISHKKGHLLVLFLLFSFILYSQETSDSAQEMRENWITYAKQFIGTPYLYGGLTKEGIDCSGLMYITAAQSIELQLPRTVSDLYSYARIIPDSKKEEGDLVFFKTVDSKVSHVGLYMGKNQFIHAASDGPNTGVIVSSLTEAYWKEAYMGPGQVLSSPKQLAEIEIAAKKEKQKENNSTVENNEKAPSDSSNKKSFSSFISNAPIQFDASLSMDWNFFTSEEFLWSIRGGSIQVHASYTDLKIHPGIALDVRIDPKMGIVQIPILFTLSPSSFLRVYAGPVFTIGQPHLTGTEKSVKGSIFPGILGVSWQTPQLKLGSVGLCFVQDLSYTVFNEEDNSALPFLESFSAGFLFMTGIRAILNP